MVWKSDIFVSVQGSESAGEDRSEGALLCEVKLLRAKQLKTLMGHPFVCMKY